MSIDRAHIGLALPAQKLVVAPEEVRRFAEAIGAEEPSLSSGVAPPTFLKVLEGVGNSSRAILQALGVDLKHVLHVEQEFEYGEPVCAGDEVTVERRVADIFERQGGALEFILIESNLHSPSGKLIGRSRQWLLVRQGPDRDP